MEEYDIEKYIKPIIKSIRGENNEDINSRTRKVLEIYTFRLLYNFLNKDYNDFTKYDFNSKFLTYRSIFMGNESIEVENPKFIDFCGKSIEDFINIPDETPKESIDEQNFYTHSLLSTLKAVSEPPKSFEISISKWFFIFPLFILNIVKGGTH